MDYKGKALESFFDTTILDVAERFHYSEENMTVLSGNEALFYEKYPDTVKWIKSNALYRKDNRTPFQFAQNMVRSWLVEDYLALNFSSMGVRTLLNAHDRDRKIVSDRGVTAEPDLRILINGSWEGVEVVCDYGSHTKYYNTIPLRDNKYPMLLSSRAFVLVVDVQDKSFAVVPVNATTKVSYRSKFEKFGGKPAYILDVPGLVFSTLSTILSQVKKYNYEAMFA